ncbi:hypothetical protein [Embleya sp. NPDC050493]|uniref:hypothetical protein n=1 Tax=Embleya sp. NPDC050493 TaxID=3363989 RepID=UPI00379E6CF8
MINAEDLIGRRLLRVTTSWHHYPDTEPSLLHMWLHLDDLGPVRFHTLGDDLDLRIDEPHDHYDLDEYGHVTVEDDPADFPMSPFVDRRIVSLRPIRYRDADIDYVTGVTLQFESGDIRVLAVADELVLAHERHLGTIESHLHEEPAITPSDIEP